MIDCRTVIGEANDKLLTKDMIAEVDAVFNRAWEVDLENKAAISAVAQEINNTIALLKRQRGDTENREKWRVSMIESLAEVRRINKLYI